MNLSFSMNPHSEETDNSLYSFLAWPPFHLLFSLGSWLTFFSMELFSHFFPLRNSGTSNQFSPNKEREEGRDSPEFRMSRENPMRTPQSNIMMIEDETGQQIRCSTTPDKFHSKGFPTVTINPEMVDQGLKNKSKVKAIRLQ